MAKLLPVVLLGLVLAIATAGGCGDAATPGAESASAAPAAVNRYDVRGTVAAVAESAGGLNRVSIAHEPVPGFRDLETNEVVGMPAMTMPFPLAEGVEPPAVGALVLFTLLVDGGDHGGLPYVIESIEPVPDATIVEDR